MKRYKAGEAREPSIYYPTGKRHYARVVPTDDIQGKVAVNGRNFVNWYCSRLAQERNIA